MMNAFKFISTIIALLALMSFCQLQERVYKVPVIVYRYNFYKQDSIVRSNEMKLIREVTNDSIVYEYKNSESIEEYFYLLKTSKKDKRYINIYDLECPLVDEKEVQLTNRSYKILKYDYDKEYVSDEETSYFFCEDYGLLIVDNYTHYGVVNSFEYDSISKVIVNFILQRKNDFGITEY